MSHVNLRRVRHGARAVLGLGVVVSIIANVLHAADNPISQAISAWAPIALMLTIELIARVPIRGGFRSVARLIATTAIAGIAAWVSYWHMAGVAQQYGETGASAYLLPLTVDGLVVVAWVSLVEIAGRIRETQVSMPVPTPADRIVWQYERPIGPEPEAKESDSLSDSKPAVRKPPPSSRDRVVAAHMRTPAATDAELAARLRVSVKTIERYRPSKVSDKLSDSDVQVNGNVPDLEGLLS